jgi:putative redox protein
MTDLTVRYEDGDRLRISIRGHELTVDQPVSDGGEDTAPTPTELFVAGLAACVGFYAERYLRRHGLPTDGLEVECSFAFAADRPARVGDIEIRLILPGGFPEDRRKALLAVVEHCTVHNSLVAPPEVKIALEP